MEITFETLPKAVTELFCKVSNIERMMLESKPDATDNLLSIKQAGEFLGLSVPTLYLKVSKKEIPVCKKGNRLYFTKESLVNWVKGGAKQTVSEINANAHNYLKSK
jgi:excisionase family DNA binding protein